MKKWKKTKRQKKAKHLQKLFKSGSAFIEIEKDTYKKLRLLSQMLNISIEKIIQKAAMLSKTNNDKSVVINNET